MPRAEPVTEPVTEPGNVPDDFPAAPALRAAFVDRVDVTDLAADPRNANEGTARGASMLEDSLQAFGAGRSLLVDKNNVLIAGNKTWEKAGELGFRNVIVVDSDGTDLVAVRRTDLDMADPATRARELALADNAVGEASLSWSPEVLRALADDGVDMTQFFSDEEFEGHMARLAASAEDAQPGDGSDPDDVPLDPETRVQAGDVWQCGRHRVACLSALSREHVLALTGGEMPQMVWADPPYGIGIVAVNGYVGNGAALNIPFGGVGGETPETRERRLAGAPGKTTERLGSTDRAKPFGRDAVRGSVGASNRVEVGRYAPVIGDDTTDTATDAYDLAADMFPGAVHVWWGGNYYAHALPPSPCWLVWDKENTGNFADAELAWTNQGSAVRIFRHMWNGMLRASERGEARVHPTQKPVALAEWAFERYGAPDDLILDPFLGSGMSLVAAERTGRRVYGLELSEAYCDVVLARWEAVTGEVAVLLVPGPGRATEAQKATEAGGSR